MARDQHWPFCREHIVLSHHSVLCITRICGGSKVGRSVGRLLVFIIQSYVSRGLTMVFQWSYNGLPMVLQWSYDRIPSGGGHIHKRGRFARRHKHKLLLASKTCSPRITNGAALLRRLCGRGGGCGAALVACLRVHAPPPFSARGGMRDGCIGRRYLSISVGLRT